MDIHKCSFGWDWRYFMGDFCMGCWGFGIMLDLPLWLNIRIGPLQLWIGY